MAKKWTRWTEEEIALLLSDYRQALSLDEIAAKHDRSRWSITGQLNLLRKAGRLPDRSSRYCPRCEKHYPVDRFYSTSARRRSIWCKQCFIDYGSERWKKQKST